jgi:hypothetical protein
LAWPCPLLQASNCLLYHLEQTTPTWPLSNQLCPFMGGLSWVPSSMQYASSQAPTAWKAAKKHYQQQDWLDTESCLHTCYRQALAFHCQF